MNIGDNLLYKACYSVPDTLACKHYKLVESGIFSHVNDFRVERCIGGINCAWACLNSEQPGGIPIGYNLIPIPVGYNLIPIPCSTPGNETILHAYCMLGCPGNKSYLLYTIVPFYCHSNSIFPLSEPLGGANQKN